MGLQLPTDSWASPDSVAFWHRVYASVDGQRCLLQLKADPSDTPFQVKRGWHRTAELLQSSPEIYALLAELAVALAGFTGVASTFAGRERKFRPMERTRLQAILLGSSSVLAGCLALYSATSLGISHIAGAAIAGGVGFVLTLPVLAVLVPAGIRHRKDLDSTTESWVIFVVVVYSLCLLATFGAVALRRGPPDLLVFGFSVQLLFGLWMFVRLLTRPN